MKRTLYLLLLFALFLSAGGCGNRNDSPSKEAGEAAEAKPTEGAETGETGEAAGGDIVLDAEAVETAGIEVTEAKRIPMQGQLKVPGTVTNTSQGRALVTPPVGGKITRLFLKIGDSVRAGQPIATIHSAELAEAAAAIIEAQRGVISAEADVREAKAQIDLSNAKLRTARQSLERQQEFARTGAFSQPSLAQAQRELNEAEAELETAQQDLAVHETQLERAERLFKQELISRTELEQARLAVQQDRIRKERAGRQVEIARTTFEREKQIASRNLLNSREIQAAEAEVRSANIEVQQARIRHQTALSAVAGANKGMQAARASYAAQAGGSRAGGGSVTVIAPIGGVVTEREATLGQAVERTSEICEIENLRSVWVTASVPERSIALARRGSPAQVIVSAFPNRVFPGVVQVVGSRLDPKTRTMPVQVLVENSSGALRADMFATVSLGVGTNELALAVPRSALAEVEGKQKVFIQEEPGRFMPVEVATGRVQGEWVEIVKGLEPGAKVAHKGVFVLKSQAMKGELKGDED